MNRRRASAALSEVTARLAAAYGVIAVAGPVSLQVDRFPVHYSLDATCWTLLVSAAVGVVALWPMEIALRWMTRPRAPLTLKVPR